MSTGDILLLGLCIAAAIRAVRRARDGVCGGDCARCRGGGRRKNS